MISSQYLFLKGRSPYALHDLVGANTLMLQLMKDNKEVLGIAAQDSHFDETIARTFQMLQEQSLDLELQFLGSDNDSAFFAFQTTNKTGHKFPSGYPARRAFVEFVVTTEFGDTLFHSGAIDQDYEIIGQDAEMEPHHLVIDDPGQVQIYEFVPADVQGNFTTILERAFQTLKDNRLPPIGFTKSHSAYDTTRIHGDALADPDFNMSDSGEGNGSDRLQYHIPLGGYEGYLKICAKVHYQSLPPKWMAPLFADSTPEIELFRTMYDAADLTPVLIGERVIDSVLIESPSSIRTLSDDVRLILYPNPSEDGLVYLSNPDNIDIEGVDIYDLRGRQLVSIEGNASAIQLPAISQTLIVVIRTKDGLIVRKLLTR